MFHFRVSKIYQTLDVERHLSSQKLPACVGRISKAEGQTGNHETHRRRQAPVTDEEERKSPVEEERIAGSLDIFFLGEVFIVIEVF